MVINMNKDSITQEDFININQHLLDNVLAMGLFHCNLIKYNFMLFTNILSNDNEVIGFILDFFNGKQYIFLKDTAIATYLSALISKK